MLKLIVSDEWLKACGSMHLSGIALEIERIQPMRNNESMYHVIEPNGRKWTVWSIRGITLV